MTAPTAMSLREQIKSIPGVRATGKWLRSRSYRYYCPVCRQRVEKFHPLARFFIENKRKHGWPYQPEDMETSNVAAYSCPHCDASDRYRLYALYLDEWFEKLKRPGALDLLEFAPHPGFSSYLKSLPDVRYRTADLFAEGVDDRVDIMDMRIYPAGRFDVFVCSHVLEHVPDDRKALAELYRILKPGGWGILMVPINLAISEIDEDPSLTDESERWRRFGQLDHVRLYSRSGFLDRVQSAGFIIKQYGVEYFGLREFARCGITKQSVLYVVQKAR
jgi:SAM-dependent methyltransferase